jgi:hypothetical protein
VLHALAAQIEAGVVRLLDFVIVSRSEAGMLNADEIDLAEFSLGNLDPLLPGIVAEEDVTALGRQLAPGDAAAIVAFELVWARELAEQLAADGSYVLESTRIPAPVVNALVELADEV